MAIFAGICLIIGFILGGEDLSERYESLGLMVEHVYFNAGLVNKRWVMRG